MRTTAAANIEAELEKLSQQFEEELKKGEEKLNAITVDGSEDELKAKVEQTFNADKETHEPLQQILSKVEE